MGIVIQQLQHRTQLFFLNFKLIDKA